jgi:hypothetical protein
MATVIRCCRRTIESLLKFGVMVEPGTGTAATDVLWTMLSISGYEQVTTSANWPARQYLNHIKTAARRLFVTHSDRTQLSGVTQ